MDLKVSCLSDASEMELKPLIGKTITGIDAGEYHFIITFEGGGWIELNGSRWNDCALGVEVGE